MIPLAAKDISVFFDVVKNKIVTYSVGFIATQVSGENGFYSCAVAAWGKVSAPFFFFLLLLLMRSSGMS